MAESLHKRPFFDQDKKVHDQKDRERIEQKTVGAEESGAAQKDQDRPEHHGIPDKSIGADLNESFGVCERQGRASSFCDE